jgi:hypothetical protein
VGPILPQFHLIPVLSGAPRRHGALAPQPPPLALALTPSTSSSASDSSGGRASLRVSPALSCSPASGSSDLNTRARTEAAHSGGELPRRPRHPARRAPQLQEANLHSSPGPRQRSARRHLPCFIFALAGRFRDRGSPMLHLLARDGDVGCPAPPHAGNRPLALAPGTSALMAVLRAGRRAASASSRVPPCSQGIALASVHAGRSLRAGGREQPSSAPPCPPPPRARQRRTDWRKNAVGPACRIAC